MCISGLVLQGVKKPHDCPAFGKQCTPEHPLGATMVSAEGACAAYYAYGRHLQHTTQPKDSRLFQPTTYPPRTAIRVLLGTACPLPITNYKEIVLAHGSGGATQPVS